MVLVIMSGLLILFCNGGAAGDNSNKGVDGLIGGYGGGRVVHSIGGDTFTIYPFKFTLVRYFMVFFHFNMKEAELSSLNHSHNCQK